MRSWIYLSLLLFCPVLLRATHIVGGEMTYTCLGDNNYEITLTIFRDCYYGNPNAWFDNPASIGVFNSQNQLLWEILVPLMNNDTLDPVLSGECFVVPPDVCVHTTTYHTIVNLPPIIGGYQLAYQRCCRNQTILNIVDPLASGATYGVTITERALLECNNSAKFQQWPPLFICVNEPIEFDQSAIDPDGDSIVYKLCAPWLGADQVIPQPQPPNPPPFQPVVWVDPPYGVNNMLNGAPGGSPLHIDLHSGLLTGLPNTIGQFVVGICIEEYRDGELISTTRRDFQYNVGVCGQSAAAFFAPEIQCGSLNVQFTNQSQGATNYFWMFNDPANPGATSTLKNPTYTYADTGHYTVTLITDPGSTCQDTFSREINLQYQSLTADFSYALTHCSDSLTIEVNDLSIDTISSPVSWSWKLAPTGQVSTEQNPAFYVTSSQTVTLMLTVEAANGCTATAQQTFPVQLINEVIEQDSVALCSGGLIMLNPIFNPSYTYQWSPAGTLLNPNVPNPFAGPTETTTYTVTITDAEDFCRIERQVTVIIPDPIVIDIPNDTTICSPTILLQGGSNTGVQYYWAYDSNFINIISQADTALVTPFGTTTYYLLVRDSYGCFDTESVEITGNGINIQSAGDPIVCEGDLAGVVVLNQDPADTLTYHWEPAGEVLFYGNQNAAVVQPTHSGISTYYVYMENQYGCTNVDSVMVTVIDTSSQLEFLSQVQCSGYAVNFNSTSVNAPFYQWHFGDPAHPTATAFGPTSSHTYAAPGDYTVMVTLAPGYPCPDTLFRTVTVGASPVNLDFSWDYQTCTDTAVIQFNDLSVNSQSDILDRTWLFSNGTMSNDVSPTVTLFESTELGVRLIVQSANGCVDTLSNLVIIPLLEANPADTVIACSGNSVSLFPAADPTYSYQWSPVETLDNPSAPNPTAMPSQTTAYSVTITDDEGNCTVSRQVTAFIPPAITATVPADTSICATEITLTAQSGTAITYEWFINTQFPQVIGTGPSVTVQPGRPSTYYLKVGDSYGCSFLDSVTVSSYGIQLSLSGPGTICIGDTARITAINLAGDPLTYSWTPVEAILSGADTNSPLVSPEISTHYVVSAANAFGCSTAEGVQLNIFNYTPPLTATAEPDTIVGGESSQLNATLDNTYTYLWTPTPTLNQFDISNPVAMPTETTTYEVTVRDPNGCINQALVTVVVLNLECREPNIFVPNGFSPNGDGLNDVLFVRGPAIDEMYFSIYNRWGQKVFESRSPDQGWDGTFNGKLLAPEAFGYYLQVKCVNGEEYFKKGNITLLR